MPRRCSIGLNDPQQGRHAPVDAEWISIRCQRNFGTVVWTRRQIGEAEWVICERMTALKIFRVKCFHMGLQQPAVTRSRGSRFSRGRSL